MYQATPTRAHPRFIVILDDESTSTGDPLAIPFAGATTIAEGIAHCVNTALKEIAYVSRDGAEILDYYCVTVAGYRDDGVEPGLAGELATLDPIPISKIASNPIRVDDATPIWIEPKSSGWTPMVAAYQFACSTISSWLVDHPDGPAPIVINITDGEPTDGDPTEHAKNLVALGGSDGPVIHFTIHVSGHDETPILFPDTAEDLPNRYARWLFEISSVMPEFMSRAAADNGCVVSSRSKCFLFNSGIDQLMTALKIGTVVSTAR